MDALKKRIVFSKIREYILNNKKLLIAVFATLVLAVIVGVVSTIRAVNGEFERVAPLSEGAGYQSES